MVYIIKNGEFEVTKRIKTEEKRQIDMIQFIGPYQELMKEEEANYNRN